MPVPDWRRNQINNFMKHHNYDDIVRFVRNGDIPDDRNTEQKMINFGNALEGVEYRNGKLWLEDLEILKDVDAAKRKIKEFYKSNLSLGMGIASIYGSLCDKYLNVKRDTVAEVLRTFNEYQIENKHNDPHLTLTSRPLLSGAPNKLWLTDLLDLSAFEYRRYRYIVTFIDHFSRRWWARALTNKTPATVLQAFCEVIVEAASKPGRIAMDNGTEYKA